MSVGYNDDFGDENDEVGTVGGVKFSKKMVKRMNKQKDFQRKGKRSVDEEQQPQQQEQQQDKLAQQPDTFQKTTVEVSRKRKILANDDNGDEYVVEKTSGGPKRKKFLKRSQIDKDILAINANKGGAVETKKNFIDQSGTLKLIDEIAGTSTSCPPSFPANCFFPMYPQSHMSIVLFNWSMFPSFSDLFILSSTSES